MEHKKEDTLEKILVVENDEGILNNLKIMLETEGYIVHTALNGLEALKKIENTLPDLIITDVKTPYMDGMELKARISTRSKTNRTPFIIMVDKVELDNYIKEELINDLIAKPFVIDDILSMIENKLQRKREHKLLTDENIGKHIAHRLRSPLTPMLSFLEFMINEKDISKEKYKEVLERVMRSANTLYNSVETFLFFYDKKLQNDNCNILPLMFDKTFFENIISQHHQYKRNGKIIIQDIEPAVLKIEIKGMERLILEIFNVMKKYFNSNNSLYINGRYFNEAYLFTIEATKNSLYKYNIANMEELKQKESEMNVLDINTIERIIEMYGGKILFEETGNRKLLIKVFLQIP
jgi:DNA-binding response OmpR family regulator